MTALFANTIFYRFARISPSGDEKLFCAMEKWRASDMVGEMCSGKFYNKLLVSSSISLAPATTSTRRTCELMPSIPLLKVYIAISMDPFSFHLPSASKEAFVTSMPSRTPNILPFFNVSTHKRREKRVEGENLEGKSPFHEINSLAGGNFFIDSVKAFF